MCAGSSIGNGSSEEQKDVLIFGGSTRTQELSSAAFVLDTQTWIWRKLLQSDQGGGEVPAPLASSSAASVIGRDNQCIISGRATLGDSGYAGGLIPQHDTWLLTVNGD